MTIIATPGDPITAALRETSARMAALAADTDFVATVHAAGDLLSASLRNGGTTYSCGNGGSMCDAMHFAEELTGRYRLDRRPLRAQAISDPSHLTCVANDYGFEEVFSRHVEAFARRGDVLVALSTSGTSRNVLRAAEKMRELGGHVIGLTGPDATALAAIADVTLAVGYSGFADRVQEVHILLLHTLVQLVEQDLGLTNQ